MSARNLHKKLLHFLTPLEQPFRHLCGVKNYCKLVIRPVAQFDRKFTCVSVYIGVHIAVVWAVLTKTCCGRFFENLGGCVSCKDCARVEFD